LVIAVQNIMDGEDLFSVAKCNCNGKGL
jgi:hypothetical protein